MGQRSQPGLKRMKRCGKWEPTPSPFCCEGSKNEIFENEVEIHEAVAETAFHQDYHPFTPTIEFWNGFDGLAALGPAASNAVPQLVRMLERDPSPFTQQAVPVILGRVGPAAPFQGGTGAGPGVSAH